MKKILALVLALCMVFALCACGSSSGAVSYTHLDVYKRQKSDRARDFLRAVPEEHGGTERGCERHFSLRSAARFLHFTSFRGEPCLSLIHI